LVTKDTRHLLTCGKSKRRAFLIRHDLVVQQLKALATLAGGVATLLPRVQNAVLDRDNEEESKGKKYPDLQVVTGHQFSLLDVTVVFPGTNTNLESASKIALSTAKAAEKLKDKKYKLLIEKEIDSAESEQKNRTIYKKTGKLFIPFALETNGSFGPMARNFISRLAELAEAHGTYTKKAFKQIAYRDISVVLQRGNALALSYHLTDANCRLVPNGGGGGGGGAGG
jgi:hypothetical protein